MRLNISSTDSLLMASKLSSPSVTNAALKLALSGGVSSFQSSSVSRHSRCLVVIDVSQKQGSYTSKKTTASHPIFVH